MATYDQNGKPVDELEEIQITATRPKPVRVLDWSGLVFALLAGVVVFMFDERPRRRIRRR